MLSRPMRTLDRLLPLLLALLLGLGPLGAAVLAESLHGPFCGCMGCAPGGTSSSCCAVVEPETSGPNLAPTPSPCACRIAAPVRDASPSVTVRTCDARSDGRFVLERSQATVARAWTPLERSILRAQAPPGRAAPPGPPGSERAHGAARAAAFGPQLL